jgi:hypothetical protein
MPLEAENRSLRTAAPTLNFSARREWHVAAVDLRKTVPVTIVQDDEWAPGPNWSCVQNLTPTLAQTPKHPARNVSQSRPS